MERAGKPPPDHTSRPSGVDRASNDPAAVPAHQRGPEAAPLDTVDASAGHRHGAAQRAIIEGLRHSPRIVAQRDAIPGMYGAFAQLADVAGQAGLDQGPFVTSRRSASQAPSRDGAPPKGVAQRAVKITDALSFNVDEAGRPTIGQPVLNSPPEYLNADVDGKPYRLKAGQNFISESKGADYIANPGNISGADARLLKPMVEEAEADDVRVVGDGHHKLLFSTYHGKASAGGTKLGFLKGQPWSGLKWTKDIKDK